MYGKVGLFLVALLPLASSAPAASAARSFTPNWSVGTRWTVETRFRNAGPADGAGQWSGPVVFDYTVTEKRADGDRTLYTVTARPREEGTGFDSSITVAATARQAGIDSVQTHHRRFGRIVTDTVLLDGRSPAFTASSVIPYDAPVFPVTKPAGLHTSNYMATKRKFTRVESVGGISFAKVASQLAKPLANPSAYVDRNGSPVDFKVAAEAADVIPVEMVDESTRQRVVQYWSSSYPWFLYSENNSSKSWLVNN